MVPTDVTNVGKEGNPVRILILELYQGQSDANLESLLDGTYHVGIDIEKLTLGDIIPDVTGMPTEDYFEYLHSAPSFYHQDTIDTVTGKILKEIRSFDYVCCPVGTESGGSLLGYILSWILSYTDPGALRGAVYYTDVAKIQDDEVGKSLYESFKNIFEFEKIVTKSGDVLFLDMQDKHKQFFRNMSIDKIKS